MKNVIALFASVVIAASVMAQNAPTKTQTQTQTKTQTVTKTTAPTQTVTKEYVVMKNGKVWEYKNGSLSEVKAEVTIGGSKVQPDGKVTMKDGTTATLKDGDRVLADGKIKTAVAKTTTVTPKAADKK